MGVACSFARGCVRGCVRSATRLRSCLKLLIKGSCAPAHEVLWVSSRHRKKDTYHQRTGTIDAAIFQAKPSDLHASVLRKMTDHITEYSDRSLTYEKDTLEAYYSEPRAIASTAFLS
jgi:hypothetical protein